MLTKFDDDPLAATYALCKEHAAVDGAVSERVTRQYFEAAWALCAEHIGLVYPARNIDEFVPVDQETGTIRLTFKPSSPVTLMSGYNTIAVMPPDTPCLSGNLPGCGELCCHCSLRAIYVSGNDLDCGSLPPLFVQAVLQLFAYMVENRGDTAMERDLLYISGAHAFLGPEVTYVM